MTTTRISAQFRMRHIDWRRAPSDVRVALKQGKDTSVDYILLYEHHGTKTKASLSATSYHTAVSKRR